MTTVTTEQAQSELSHLLERVRLGETIAIEQEGEVIGHTSPVPEKSGKRRLGFMRGQFTVPEDFHEMMRDEIEEIFYGGRDLSA